MKNSGDYIKFIDLLDDILLPSEKYGSINLNDEKNILHKDDSSIKLPDFNKIKRLSYRYGNSLVTEYLCYLV